MPKPDLSGFPEGTKMYRLSVGVQRDVSVLPIKKMQTVDDEYVLGDLPAASPLHARRIYWQNCTHMRPRFLDKNGKAVPGLLARMKIGEIKIRVLADDEPLISEIDPAFEKRNA